MSDFTLRQLDAFIAVVEERSVTGAAQRLRLSPGAVSVAIRELETALDAQLLLRKRGSGASPTPTGLVAYERAKSTLAEAASLRGVAHASNGELTGALRIGCFPTLSPWFLPAIAEFLAERHPAIEPHFLESTTPMLLERMRAGEMDAALMYANHLPSDFAGPEIAAARLQAVVAADHPLAALDEIPLAALAGEPAILLGIEPSLSHVEEIIRAAGHVPVIRWRSTNAETIRSMVARGLGYTIIMGRPYGDRSVDGLPLVYRRIADELPRNAVVLASPAGTRAGAKLDALRAFCEQQFRRDRDILSA